MLTVWVRAMLGWARRWAVERTPRGWVGLLPSPARVRHPTGAHPRDAAVPVTAAARAGREPRCLTRDRGSR